MIRIFLHYSHQNVVGSHWNCLNEAIPINTHMFLQRGKNKSQNRQILLLKSLHVTCYKQTINKIPRKSMKTVEIGFIFVGCIRSF